MSGDHDDLALAGLTGLLEDAHLATGNGLPGMVAVAGRRMGFDVVVYLVDYEQRVLVPLDGAGPAGAPLDVDGSVAGRAFRAVAPMTGRGEPPRLWVPMLDGVERLGVLEVVPRDGSDPDDESLRTRARWLAALAGHLVAVKAPYGDTLDAARRRRPRSVAAELVWQLLPPLTFGCDGLVVSGMVEPCYEVAGDTFDYAVTGRTLWLAVFDAVGHTLRSGLLSAVTLSTYRNARREGSDLPDVAARIEEVLLEQFGPEAFVTGVLATLDLDSGRLRYVVAGHPRPLVMRGHQVVRSLSAAVRLPFGLGEPGVQPAVEQLEPGDRLVLYTDGIPEARDEAGRFFGMDRFTGILERGAATEQPAPETLRQVVHAVLHHQRGRLQDDATIVIAQWAVDAHSQLQP